MHDNVKTVVAHQSHTARTLKVPVSILETQESDVNDL